MITRRRPREHRAHVDLSVEPRAASIARRTVADALRLWRVPGPVIDDAQLVASELVTNAQRYGSRPVELAVALRADELTVAVADGSGAMPVPVGPAGDDPAGPAAPADPADPAGLAGLAERGRGLPIVAAVAQAWGVRALSGGGKSVWALFRIGRYGRGAPVSGAPVSGAPVSGAPVSGAPVSAAPRRDAGTPAPG